MKKIAEAAQGRWLEILAHFGIGLPARGKHGPCPACGGKDRFRFDDKEQRGTFYCSGCGAGDGFILLQKVKGISLQAATEAVAVMLGITPDQKPTVKDDPTKAMRALWDRAYKPVDGGPVDLYLQNRLGCHEPPLSIREHYDVYDPETKQSYPAMIAKIASPENKAVNLHITYLTFDGRKADIPKPKRVMAGKLPEGCAIRLAPAAEVMGIAEGIETAMAASIMFDMPVWAAVSGVGLSKWTPPASAKIIYVFGDNDESFAGQSKAYALAHRLAVIFKREVVVELPAIAGNDWNDDLSAFNAGQSMGELTNPFR
jgi:putative DNA primase/helicase